MGACQKKRQAPLVRSRQVLRLIEQGGCITCGDVSGGLRGREIAVLTHLHILGTVIYPDLKRRAARQRE